MARPNQGTLGEWLTFRNGRTSPERSELGTFEVFGSNGVIGHASQTNVDTAAIVIGRVGSYCGSTYFAPQPCWVTDNAIVAIPNVEGEARFWYYVLSTARLNERRQGSGQPLLNQSILTSIEFEAPRAELRIGIATTLGALDDKIESNRRAIDLLQALSRSTYVAWRAIHPDTRETTFDRFADVFGGATPKTSEPSYWNGDIAWATPTDITALTAPYLFGTARTITETGLASTSATLHPAGTILMTSRATIGSFAVAHVPAATNQGFIAVRPRKPEHRWFLFEEMRARVPEMLDRANGSTFMELSRGNFKLMPVGVPDEATIAKLHSALAPLHTKAAQLDRESSRLADLRDTLLPELLSGRVRAPEAREAVEAAVG